MASKKVVKKKAVKPYEANLRILAVDYKAKGETSSEAIENLELKGHPKGVGVLTLTKGKEKQEKILTFVTINRMFNLSPTMRELAMKNVKMMFDI